MFVRCPSTVFEETNSAAATCFVWRPSATSSATRSSVGVSAPVEGARPPTRASSARARSAQARAPIPSKTVSAASSDSRAARLCFARRVHRASGQQRPAVLRGDRDPAAEIDSALQELERVARGRRARPAAGPGSGRPPRARSAAEAARRSPSTSRAALTRRPAPRARSGPPPGSARRARCRAPVSARGAGTPRAGARACDASAARPERQLEPPERCQREVLGGPPAGPAPPARVRARPARARPPALRPPRRRGPEAPAGRRAASPDRSAPRSRTPRPHARPQARWSPRTHSTCAARTRMYGSEPSSPISRARTISRSKASFARSSSSHQSQTTPI